MHGCFGRYSDVPFERFVIVIVSDDADDYIILMMLSMEVTIAPLAHT